MILTNKGCQISVLDIRFSNSNPNYLICRNSTLWDNVLALKNEEMFQLVEKCFMEIINNWFISFFSHPPLQSKNEESPQHSSSLMLYYLRFQFRSFFSAFRKRGQWKHYCWLAKVSLLSMCATVCMYTTYMYEILRVCNRPEQIGNHKWSQI